MLALSPFAWRMTTAMKNDKKGEGVHGRVCGTELSPTYFVSKTFVESFPTAVFQRNQRDWTLYIFGAAFVDLPYHSHPKQLFRLMCEPTLGMLHYTCTSLYVRPLASTFCMQLCLTVNLSAVHPIVCGHVINGHQRQRRCRVSKIKGAGGGS